MMNDFNFASSVASMDICLQASSSSKWRGCHDDGSWNPTFSPDFLSGFSRFDPATHKRRTYDASFGP